MGSFMKELLEIGVIIVVLVVVVFGGLLVPFVHYTSNQDCIEYSEKKGVTTEYLFASGCWVKDVDGKWELKRTLENGENK